MHVTRIPLQARESKEEQIQKKLSTSMSEMELIKNPSRNNNSSKKIKKKKENKLDVETEQNQNKESEELKESPLIHTNRRPVKL